jgi:serine/threonine protein kinase
MFEKLGKFEIKRILGQGSMGEVYLGFDSSMGREVAIKTILSSSPAGQEARDRFAREAKAAGLLNHPNIVTIHEFGEDQGVMFFAMEYVKGQDLEELMRSNALTRSESLEALAQICDGLSFAHQNHIVHRDIKPSNVRVLRDGQRLHVKVMDFGLARVNNSDMTATGMVMGTVSYMAPEYIRTGIPDSRSDLFAVGVMLYEFLSGRKPFSGGTTPTILYKIVNEPPEPIDLTQLHGISPRIRSVLDRALEKDPDLRFQTAAELAQALRAAKDPSWTGSAHGDTVFAPSSAPPMTRPAGSGATMLQPGTPMAAGKPPPLPRRPPAKPASVSGAAIAVMVSGVLLLLLGGGGYGYWRWKRGPEPAVPVANPAAGSSAPAAGGTDSPLANNPVSPDPQSSPSPATPPTIPSPLDNPAAGKPRQGSRTEPASFEGAPYQRDGNRETREAIREPVREPVREPLREPVRETLREPAPAKVPTAEAKPAAPPPPSATSPARERAEYVPEGGEGKQGAWTMYRVYKPSETVVVVFRNLPENRTTWIDISKAADRDGSYLHYFWTLGKSSGRLTFSGLSLEPGAYEVRVHFTRSNSANLRFPFKVE